VCAEGKPYQITLFSNQEEKGVGILASVIKEAKRNCYDEIIQNLSNKCEATWHIIKKLTNNNTLIPIYKS
jgi:hypothetical protein